MLSNIKIKPAKGGTTLKSTLQQYYLKWCYFITNTGCVLFTNNKHQPLIFDGCGLILIFIFNIKY